MRLSDAPAITRPSDARDVAGAADRSPIRILVVDDDRTVREGCAVTLRLEGSEVATAERGEVALEMLRRRRFHILLVDLCMPGMSGLDVLRAALALHRDTIVIVMTGNADLETNLEALRAGAWDYVPKPFTAVHLQLLIARATHQVRGTREARAGHQELLRRSGHSDRLTILGASRAFRSVVELARKVAQTDASVMISGESGTGKEMIAQFIHQHSRRADREFVPVNCAALPEPLLESEMFGHRRGAFTGAERDKPGLLETANGGTMFLDELSDMPRPIQAKLLRVLQDGVIRHVGSERTDAVVDVRFISATSEDPQKLVSAGTLRGDLGYRLRVVPITLPALRERPEDIPVLAQHFLVHYWNRHRLSSEAMPELTPAALDFLRAQSWPGNVRELQHVVEHLVVVAEPGQPVEPEHFVLPSMTGPAAGARITLGMLDQPYLAAKEAVLLEFEKAYLARLAVRGPRNISRAARLANVNRATLYRLIERHPDAVEGWTLTDD
jgi:DNA-binding NtrC family response regulator